MARKYKQNFLKQVLVRVDFQKPLESYEKGLNLTAEKAIQGRFPTLIEQKMKKQSFQIEAKRNCRLLTKPYGLTMQKTKRSTQELNQQISIFNMISTILLSN